MSESSHSFPGIDDSADLFEGMDSRLYIAAEEGNLDVLNKLIEGEDKLNILLEFTRLGNSVLHIAVSRGHLPFIKRLLEEVQRNLEVGREGRAFVRATNSDENSALHLAALDGHSEIVEKLIELMEGDEEAGSFVRFQNREGNTALHEAAKGRTNYKVVDALLNHDADLTTVANAVGETALFIASQSGCIRMVERLLQSMPRNSNMKRLDGQTPLHSAVFQGRRGVVKKLLQHSPDLAKQKDRCGRTAMHMLALSSSSLDTSIITVMLLKADNSLCYKVDNKKRTPLHMAVEWERYDLVDTLLISGKGCVEAVDNEGRKPLHLAVIHTVQLTRTENVLEFLQFKFMLLSLMSRKSLNHRDNIGRTPLHIAVENIEKDKALYNSIIDLLRKNGALKTPEMWEHMREINRSPPKTWIKAENVSINAVLIATVSFAAAFTLPGGLDSQHQAVFINTALFNLFLICDTLSFCTSIASAILVQYAEQDEQQDRPQVLFSIRLLWSALMSLVVAFGAAVHLVVAPSPWLAGVLWTLVSLVPIAVSVALARSKWYLSVAESSKILVALLYPYATIGWMVLFVFDILNMFLFSYPFWMCLWIRKASRRASLKSIYRRVLVDKD